MKSDSYFFYSKSDLAYINMNGFLLGDSNTGTVIFSLPLKPSFGLPGLSGGHFRVPLKNGNYGPSIPPTTTSVQSNFKNNQDRKEQDKGAAAALTAFVFTYLMKSEGVLSDCLSGEQAIGSRRGSKLGKSLPPNNHNNHISKNRCLTPVFRCINGVTLEIFWHDTLPVFCVTVSTSFDTTGSSLSMGGGGVDVRHTNTLSEFGIRFGSRVIEEAFSPLFGKLLMAYHGKQLAEGQSRRLNGFQDDTSLSTPLFPAEDFFKSSSIKIIKKQMMPIVKLLYRDHTILMICRTIERAGERATIISSCQKKEGNGEERAPSSRQSSACISTRETSILGIEVPFSCSSVKTLEDVRIGIFDITSSLNTTSSFQYTPSSFITVQRNTSRSISWNTLMMMRARGAIMISQRFSSTRSHDPTRNEPCNSTITSAQIDDLGGSASPVALVKLNRNLEIISRQNTSGGNEVGVRKAILSFRLNIDVFCGSTDSLGNISNDVHYKTITESSILPGHGNISIIGTAEAFVDNFISEVSPHVQCWLTALAVLEENDIDIFPIY